MVESQLAQLVTKLRLRDDLSSDEVDALRQAATEPRVFTAGSDLVREGDLASVCTLILSGFACRYNVTETGKRQISAIQVVGDFVDLHSLPLKRMDHSVGALTDCEVLLFPHANLEIITEQQPHLTRLLWMLTLIDGAIHRRWLLAMGGTSAASRMAHFFCELYTRLRTVGLTDDHSMPMPLTQAELGDILGISTVHVNRVIQDLRADRLVEWSGGEVRIRDWPALAALGQFDPSYLLLEKLRR